MYPSLTLLALRLSNATTAASIGAFCDPAGYVNSSETTSTAFGAGGSFDTGTTGLKGTPQTFRAVVATQTEIVLARLLIRVPWTLTTAAPAGARGTIQASATITPPGGTPITCPATLGGTRALDSANGTLFAELIALDMPSGLTFTPGTTIDLTVQPIVQVAAAGTTFLPTLRHNPANVADQLVMEIDGAAGVS